MEINCPQCSQRLRVPDGLKNPLLRCKNCSSKFHLEAALGGSRNPIRESSDRWQSSRVAPQGVRDESRWTPPLPSTSARDTSQPWNEATAPAIEVVDEDSFPPIERRAEPTFAEKTKSVASSGLGTAALVLVIFLFKGGPRIARHFFRDQPPQQPPPVQMDRDRAQEFRKMRQEIERRIAEQKLRQQNQFEVPRELPPN